MSVFETMKKIATITKQPAMVERITKLETAVQQEKATQISSPSVSSSSSSRPVLASQAKKAIATQTSTPSVPAPFQKAITIFKEKGIDTRNIEKVSNIITSARTTEEIKKDIGSHLPDTYDETIPIYQGDKVKVRFKQNGKDVVTFIPVEKYETWSKDKDVTAVLTSGRDEKQIWRAPTEKEIQEASINAYKQKYIETGFIPYEVRKQIVFDEKIREAGINLEEVTKVSYEAGLGMISQEEADKRLNEMIFQSANIDWMKEHGTFKDTSGKEVTWEKIKTDEPAMFITKGEKAFEITYDPKKWGEIEHKRAVKEGDYGFLAGEFLSPILSGEVWTAMFDSKNLPSTSEVKTTGLFDLREPIKPAAAEGFYEYSKAVSKGDIPTVAGRLISTPLVSAPLSFGVGAGIGAGMGFLTGAATTHTALTASQASNILKGGQIIMGGAMVGYMGKDLYETYQTEGTDALNQKLIRTGINLLSGYAGYRTGMSMKIKGATTSQWGAHKTYTKTVENLMMKSQKFGGQTTFNPKGGFESISFEQGIPALRYKNIAFKITRLYQSTPTRFQQIETSHDSFKLIRDVKAFKGQPAQAEYGFKLAKHMDAELYGSISRGTAKDLDLMVSAMKYGKSIRITEFAGKKLGFDSAGFDIHPSQRVGSIVTTSGGLKQMPYRIGGLKWMRWTETALRRTDSSGILAHEGRIKDIGRSFEDWMDVYKAAGAPIKHKPLFIELSKASIQYGKNPLIMGEKLSFATYYKPTLTEKYAEFSNRIITKYMPGRTAKEFGIIMKTEIPSVTNIPKTSGGLPPSPKLSLTLISPTTATVSYFTSPISIDKSTGFSTPSISMHPTSFIRPMFSPSRSFSGKYPSSLFSPSLSPSISPSISPSVSPSISPSLSPSISPSLSPSISPSISPSVSPSISPSISPSLYPYIPPMGIYGRGKKGGSFSLYSKKFRFRKAQIFDPFKTSFKLEPGGFKI